jgi:small-conductance mechanosensitive channel
MPVYLARLPHDGIVAVVILIAVAFLALVAQGIVFSLLRKLAARNDGPLQLVVARATGPSRFIFPLVAIESTLPVVSLPESGKSIAEHTLGLLIIAAVAWVLVALVQLAADLTKRRYRLDIDDNLHARQIETRLDILTRASITIVLFVSTAIALTTFPAIRAVGATLLASAGLIGIMAGFAARPIFENLVAGIQIALTQPIRIDDVLIVEGEYGRVEKIGSTYVVVRLWDWRRMVLPLTYFIDKPFQNWTYTTANLIGSVMLYVDYSIPVDALRKAVGEIIEQSPLWDKQVVNVALTDAKEGSIEIRILCSARNSPDLFDLRCFIREKIVTFVQENFPAGFSSTRVILAREDATQLAPSRPEATAPPSTPVPPAQSVEPPEAAAGAQTPNRVPALR